MFMFKKGDGTTTHTYVPQLHESALRYKLGLKLSQKLDLIQAQPREN